MSFDPEKERERCARAITQANSYIERIDVLMRERAAVRAECGAELAAANAWVADLKRERDAALAKLSTLRKAAERALHQFGNYKSAPTQEVCAELRAALDSHEAGEAQPRPDYPCVSCGKSLALCDFAFQHKATCCSDCEHVPPPTDI